MESNNQPETTVTACSTITTEELNAILENDNLKILDCSAQKGRQPGDTTGINFLKCHIKGA